MSFGVLCRKAREEWLHRVERKMKGSTTKNAVLKCTYIDTKRAGHNLQASWHRSPSFTSFLCDMKGAGKRESGDNNTEVWALDGPPFPPTQDEVFDVFFF